MNRKAERKIVHLKPNDVARLLRALAVTGVHPDKFILDALGGQLEAQLDRSRPVEIADALVGYGELVEMPPESLLKALASRLPPR